MLLPVGMLLVLHTFLQFLVLCAQAAVDGMIEETNAINIFELTVKALYYYTTARVCCLSKKKCPSPIIPVSINLV